MGPNPERSYAGRGRHGGVSVALPQDVPAAVFGNPATLAQFQGTQFTFGGAWVEGYPTVTRFGFADPARTSASPRAPRVSRCRHRRDPGPARPRASRDFGARDGRHERPGAEYRGSAAGSIVNDFSTEYMVLGLNTGAGFDLTDRLSVGAAVTLGTGFEQLGLVQNTAMVHDYAMRGTFGLDYELNPCNTVGLFYQTKESFQFPNAVFINGKYRDIRLAQPETIGFGIANASLMGGDLLLAADIYYKLWEDAAGYSDIFVNQWAFALGAQLTRGQMKYRAGYSYNTNPVNHNVGSRFSGLPVLQDRIYLCRHRRPRRSASTGSPPALGVRTSCFRAWTWTSLPADSSTPRTSSVLTRGLRLRLLPGSGPDLAHRRCRVSRRGRRGTSDGELTARNPVAARRASAGESRQKSTCTRQPRPLMFPLVLFT